MITKKARKYRENKGISLPEWNDIIDKLMEGYHTEQLRIGVIDSSEITITKKEYEALKKDSDNLKKARKYRENKGISLPEWNDIIDKLMEEYADQQLRLYVVSKSVNCEFLDENNKCVKMCLTRCVDGNKFWK